MGSKNDKREFLYVEYLSKDISLLIETDTDEDILNVGSGQEVSIKELAIKIKNVINFQGDLKFDKTKPDGNPRKLLDSTKINELGWFSEVSLDDGLIKTYEWFLKNN